jgi:hypothetical protein
MGTVRAALLATRGLNKLAEGIKINICAAIISSSRRWNSISKRRTYKLFSSIFGWLFRADGTLNCPLHKALSVTGNLK